jgi:hypothetical protein
MQITLTWQTVVTAAAIIGAFVAVVSYLRKLFGWFERQEKQDREIKAIKDEQSVLTYGVLACLKGLKEQGCNGPVTEAINKIEKHLNEEAHKHEA